MKIFKEQMVLYSRTIIRIGNFLEDAKIFWKIIMSGVVMVETFELERDPMNM